MRWQAVNLIHPLKASFLAVILATSGGSVYAEDITISGEVKKEGESYSETVQIFGKMTTAP